MWSPRPVLLLLIWVTLTYVALAYDDDSTRQPPPPCPDPEDPEKTRRCPDGSCVKWRLVFMCPGKRCNMMSAFYCYDSHECTYSSNKCDGYNDCPNGEDERGCPTKPPYKYNNYNTNNDNDETTKDRSGLQWWHIVLGVGCVILAIIVAVCRASRRSQHGICGETEPRVSTTYDWDAHDERAAQPAVVAGATPSGSQYNVPGSHGNTNMTGSHGVAHIVGSDRNVHIMGSQHSIRSSRDHLHTPSNRSPSNLYTPSNRSPRTSPHVSIGDLTAGVHEHEYNAHDQLLPPSLGNRGISQPSAPPMDVARSYESAAPAPGTDLPPSYNEVMSDPNQYKV